MSLSSSKPQSLYARFLSAKADFLDATARNDDSCLRFYREWASLLADFKSATAQGVVAPEDIRSMESTVSTINALAAAYIQVESEADYILSEMLQDISLSPSSDFEVTMAEWFLANLYDPYPTKAQKETLALRTGVSLQRVDAWMANARKLSGWTTLRQELYAGSRTATVQAAHYVFKNQQSSGITSEAIYALLIVKSKAENMLTSAQEAVLKRIGYSKHQYLDSPSTAINNPSMAAGREAKIIYPGGVWLPCTPECLDPETTSVDSFTDYEDEEDTAPPKPVAGVKRCRESEEAVRVKRPRLQRMASVPAPQKEHRTLGLRRISAPTIVPGSHLRKDNSAAITLSHNTMFSPQELLNISPVILPPRKRRSEDSEEQADCKRRRVSSISPKREDPDPFPPGLTALQSFDLPLSGTAISSTTMREITDWQSSICPEEHNDELHGYFDSFKLATPPDFSSIENPIILASQNNVGFDGFGSFESADIFAPLMPLPSFDEPPNSNLAMLPLEPLSASGLEFDTWDLFNVSNPWQDFPTDFGDALSPLPSLQSESDSSSSSASTPKSQHALLEASPDEHKVDFTQEIEHIIAHFAQ